MASHPRLSGPPTGPHAAEDLGHATHAAMWTGCIIAFIAAVFGTVAALGGGMVFWIICGVLVVVALVVYTIMSKMGMGQYTNKPIDTGEDRETIGIA